MLFLWYYSSCRNMQHTFNSQILKLISNFQHSFDSYIYAYTLEQQKINPCNILSCVNLETPDLLSMDREDEEITMPKAL